MEYKFKYMSEKTKDIPYLTNNFNNTLNILIKFQKCKG